MRVKAIPRYRYLQGRGTTIKNASEKNEEFMDIEDYAKLVELKKEAEVNPEQPPQHNASGRCVGTINTEQSSKASSNVCTESNALNLTTRDNMIEKGSTTMNAIDDAVRESSLYKMLTDPCLVENIIKKKESKKSTCQFCKRYFANERDLANHLDLRKDVYSNIVCCACDKTFAQKRYLRYHQRCHSDRNKFVCEICTRKYSRLDNLTRHYNFHTNPEKYRCTICDKTFTRKDLLKKHQKCHENKCSVQCDVCTKYFKGPIWLDSHKKLCHSQVETE